MSNLSLSAGTCYPFDPIFDGYGHVEEQRARYWDMRDLLYKPEELEEIRSVWRPD